MREIFIDTSAWGAIRDTSDMNHEVALLFREEISRKYRLVTTSYVLDETYTLLLISIGYARTVEFKSDIDVMIASGVLMVLHVSESIEKAAWDIFEKFNTDKEWSFTDCTSRVIMEQREISEVFAFDHHFEQMGFVREP